MPGVQIESVTTQYTRGLDTASTNASFAARSFSSLSTSPTTNTIRQIINFDGVATKVRSTLRIMPLGGDSNNDIVNLKVSGINRLLPRKSGLDNDLFCWSFICELACTLSSALLGVAGQDIPATIFAADTISLTAGIAVVYQGTADKDVATFVCDVSQYDLVEIEGSLGAGGDRVNWIYGF